MQQILAGADAFGNIDVLAINHGAKFGLPYRYGDNQWNRISGIKEYIFAASASNIQWFCMEI